MATPEGLLETAARLRGEVGDDLHDRLAEAVYGEAGELADRAVCRDGQHARLHVDMLVDRILTSRLSSTLGS